MVPLARLERATRGLGNRCSIHLSYRGIFLPLEIIVAIKRVARNQELVAKLSRSGSGRIKVKSYMGEELGGYRRGGYQNFVVVPFH